MGNGHLVLSQFVDGDEVGIDTLTHTYTHTHTHTHTHTRNNHGQRPPCALPICGW